MIQGFRASPAVLAAAIPALLLFSVPSACSSTIYGGADGAPPPPEASSLPDVGDVQEPPVHPIIHVTMNANDPGGSGANTEETYLNVTNVNPSKFGKLFSRTVDGDQFAEPLYMGGLVMADGKKHNVVFAATEHDSVYAFDADGAGSDADDPLWKVSVGTSTPMPSPYLAVERACGSVPCCGSFGLSESGITGTPAIDPSTSTMYVLALNVDTIHATPGGKCVDLSHCTVVRCDAPTITYRLHALDLRTGAEKYGGPVEVQGTVSGSGVAGVGGKISFDAGYALARPSLLIANHNVYFATGSYSDLGPYHGWVFAYDETSLKQTGVFNDTRDGELGGIWQSGRGLLADGSGSVYVVTGNGTFDANNAGHDYGDAVLKLSADLSEVQDYFTQQLSDYQGTNYLQDWDGDLGSSGATLIPGTSLLLASGKMGMGFLLDTQNLGKWSPAADNAVQRVRLTWRSPQPPCGGMTEWAWIYGTPVVWQGSDGMHLFVWGNADNLKDFMLDGNGKFTDSGHLCFCNTWMFLGDTLDVPDPNCAVVHSEGRITSLPVSTGAALSISSNGKELGTGIVWSTRSTSGLASHFVTPGILEAYDATDVTQPIWSSDMNASRDGLGNWAKFAPPTVANGKVYAPTFSNQLVVYGLLAQ
jgi:hypothetical protein